MLIEVECVDQPVVVPVLNRGFGAKLQYVSVWSELVNWFAFPLLFSFCFSCTFLFKVRAEFGFSFQAADNLFLYTGCDSHLYRVSTVKLLLHVFPFLRMVLKALIVLRTPEHLRGSFILRLS